ncbi:hypothetical protein [Bosea sp. (in: a-proteobacteria)]|uniref:hypothetical protein n=1 Tax=Bosea sp. (in: a-proteobacteria) TaxID=1871050 RepID=UPI002FC9BC43
MSQQPLKRAHSSEIHRDGKAMSESSVNSEASQIETAKASPEAVAEMQLEVASYIEEISLELGAMARTARLDSLAYFIDMTRLEAGITKRAREGYKNGPKRAPDTIRE